jgi:hypothetical protein
MQGQSHVAAAASSTTLDPEAVYGLLERVLAVQEAMVAALDRLAPADTAGIAATRPPLRVVR